MYEALLIWRTKFNNILDLLTCGVEFALPPLRTINQVKGLIAAFVDPIPQDHGIKILRAMNPEQLKEMTSMQKDFIPTFFEVVRGTYNQSKKIYDLNLTLDMLPEPRPRYKSESVKDKSLKFMQSEEYPLAKDDEDSGAENANAHADYESSPILGALSVQGKAVPAKDLPCYSMLHTGKCIKGPRCSFRHDTETLKKGWLTAFEALKNSPYNPRKLIPSTNERPPSKLVEIAKLEMPELDEPKAPSGDDSEDEDK
jgi:hypothetical protein